jgi:hypothetical protein
MAQRVLGRTAREEGDQEGAETWLREALETFRSIQAPFEAGRSLLELARAAGAGSAEAMLHLAEARRIFTELRVPFYVERAERLAGELAGASSLEPSGGPNAR